MEKSQKKKRKIIFLKDISPSRFPISGDKKGEKSKWFSFFSVRGEGKCERNYKKKKKKFSFFGRFLDHFWSLVCRKR